MTDRGRSGRRIALSVGLLVGALVLLLAARALLSDSSRTSPTLPGGNDGQTPRAAGAMATAGDGGCRAFGFSAPSSWNDPEVDIDRTMAAAVAAGAISVRVGIEWDRIEAVRGILDWTSADRVLRAAHDHGLTVVALLHTTPEWARNPALTPSNRHTPPGRVEDYVAFTVAVAKRYGDRAAAWEIWNEPNIADFWFPRAAPEEYAELVRATYPALKAATPAIPVIAGVLAPSPDTQWSYSPGVYLSALYRAGIRGFFDAVSHHPYPETGAANGSGGQTWAPVRLTHEIMEIHGDGAKKVWVTEFGSPTGTGERTISPERQSYLLTDAVRQLSSEPWAGPLYFYTVRDESDRINDRESNFGVYGHDWTPKPAVRALAQIAGEGGCLTGGHH